MPGFDWLKRWVSPRPRAIDKAKYHHGKGALTEADGAYHIGLFLRFCAEHAMASHEHQQRLEQLVAEPATYVLEHCAAMLNPSDLTPQGAVFAERAYNDYLSELSDVAMGGGQDAYALRGHADRKGFEQLIFAYLEQQLKRQ